MFFTLFRSTISINVLYFIQIDDISSTEELRNLLDGLLPERFDWGYRKPTNQITVTDIPSLINSVALHHTVWTSKAELDQFCEGNWSNSATYLLKKFRNHGKQNDIFCCLQLFTRRIFGLHINNFQLDAMELMYLYLNLIPTINHWLLFACFKWYQWPEFNSSSGHFRGWLVLPSLRSR